MSENQARGERARATDEVGESGRGDAEGPGDRDREPTAAGAPDEREAAVLDEVRAEAEGLKEQLLRAAAELENVRRRAERDVENAHRYGIERFAREVILVRDSLEMGLSAAEEAGVGEGAATLTDGVRATLKQLDQCLEKFGISEMDPAGAGFDPEFHEAMATLPTRDATPGEVVQVVQKGYRIHDRLLRPARVIVAREPEA